MILLLKKKELIVFNKSDLVTKEEIDKKLRIFRNKIKKKYEIISVFLNNDLKNIKKILLKNVTR